MPAWALWSLAISHCPCRFLVASVLQGLHLIWGLAHMWLACLSEFYLVTTVCGVEVCQSKHEFMPPPWLEVTIHSRKCQAYPTPATGLPGARTAYPLGHSTGQTTSWQGPVGRALRGRGAQATEEPLQQRWVCSSGLLKQRALS